MTLLTYSLTSRDQLATLGIACDRRRQDECSIGFTQLRDIGELGIEVIELAMWQRAVEPAPAEHEPAGQPKATAFVSSDQLAGE